MNGIAGTSSGNAFLYLRETKNKKNCRFVPVIIIKPKPVLMKSIAFLICASILFSLSSTAQESNEVDVTDVSKVTILAPGFSYEKRIGKFQTLHLHAYAALGASYMYSDALGSEFDFSIDPALLFQYRYYYNAKKRVRKERRTDMNSMNYFAPTYQMVLSKQRISTDQYMESSRRPINTLGLVWGMQRNYPKRFSLDANVGLGYLFAKTTVPGFNGPVSSHDGNVTLLLNINIGLWLNKKNP